MEETGEVEAAGEQCTLAKTVLLEFQVKRDSRMIRGCSDNVQREKIKED